MQNRSYVMEQVKSPDGSEKIWRYMDFTKFTSLIISNSLYFARADNLFKIDKFEGTLTPMDAIDVGGYWGGDREKEVQSVDKVIKLFLERKRKTFLSCWHKNPCESYFMWKLYAKENRSIAIQTTCEKLNQCLAGDDRIEIGEVEYIDCNQLSLTSQNIYTVFFRKRKEYESEKEVRAILVDERADENEDGKFAKVNIQELLERVYISPSSPPWFKKLCEEIIDKYGISVEVEMSSLAEDPILEDGSLYM